MSEARVGFGFKVYRLEEGRSLILGGKNFDYTSGLVGPGDADVVIHSIIDAILGAANIGDMRDNFPQDDMKYKDISSLSLLEIVKIKLDKIGYQIDNIDATIVVTEPDMEPYKELMTVTIADELEISDNQVSVKTTDTEGLGVVGEGNAIACYSVVLLSEILEEEEENYEYEDDYDDE